MSTDDEGPEEGDPEESNEAGAGAEPSGRPLLTRSGRLTASTRRRIDRIDAREQRFSYIAAAAAVGFGVAVYLTETSDKHFRLAKGQLTPQTMLIVGLVAGVLLVATTLIGRRALIGFVALLTGAAFNGTSFLLGIPYFVLAIWLLYRSYKVQKEATAVQRAARAEAAASPASRSRSAPAKATPPDRGRGKAKTPPGPVANKRYTPKQPTRRVPPPKPTRRERKAAASE